VDRRDANRTITCVGLKLNGVENLFTGVVGKVHIFENHLASDAADGG